MGSISELVIVVVCIFAICILTRSFFIGSKRADFKCQQCGYCCKRYKLIALDNAAIKRIEKAGYKKGDFLDIKSFGNFMKKVDGECIFLKKTKNKHHCSINKIKPSVCNSYPFGKILGFDYANCFDCPGIKKLEKQK